MWRLWGTIEIHTRFWWGVLKEGDHFENIGIDCRIILKLIFKNWDWETLTGMIWLRIATGRPVLMKPSDSVQCGVFLD
jgi:hypothetical protein